MAKRTNEDELNRHPQAEDVEEVVEENATAEYDEATTEARLLKLLVLKTTMTLKMMMHQKTKMKMKMTLKNVK